ncbi:MAG: REP-associated tyrosine transposase [Candidatus Acidiferrales bacterium]
MKHRTAPGFTYFVTTKTWKNRDLFRVAENAEILVRCLLHYRDDEAYLLHEFVVMPNHLHLLVTPARDTSLEKAMQLIKGGSSHEIHKQRGHKMQIWHPGFHEESIRDQFDFLRKADYIRANPVRAHLVEKSEAWAFCSAANCYHCDPAPQRLRIRTSGAEAPGRQDGNVGAKAPTP